MERLSSGYRINRAADDAAGLAISEKLSFPNIGTIDLRVDYLRPAIGTQFELHAEVLRLGSRVASTRMEFLGADGKLLSLGGGAYIVS